MNLKFVGLRVSPALRVFTMERLTFSRWNVFGFGVRTWGIWKNVSHRGKEASCLTWQGQVKRIERLILFFLSILRRVQFDNQILTRSEGSVSPVTMTTPCCDYRKCGALKLPLMWAIFLRTSSWNFENVLCVKRTSLVVRSSEQIVSKLWQVGMHASLSACFPDGLRKSNKVCVFGAESTLHCWSGIFDFGSWKGLEKVLIFFFWKICANPELFGNLFSLKISLSLFISQKLLMNIWKKIRFSTSYEHEKWG